MKIFITGIAGFLGSKLAEKLLADGHEVRGNDNLIGGDPTNVPAAAYVPTVIDCMDISSLQIAMKDFDVVYHCAAYPHEGLSVFSPAAITHSILTSTMCVASAAVNAGIKRFVNCSSMARYGSQETPFTEDMKPKPQDPYGIAKVAAEDSLKVLSKVHGFELVTCVPHNIYGPNQRYYDPFRNVVGIFINRALQGKQPIIYGDGNQKRCFSFIDDVIDPLVRLGDSRNRNIDIINLGPDDEFVTINELAEKICMLTGLEFKPIYMPGRPQEVQHATCSADKARKLLGYEPKTSLLEGLSKYIEWVRKKGVRDFEYHLPIEINSEKAPKTWTKKLMSQ